MVVLLPMPEDSWHYGFYVLFLKHHPVTSLFVPSSSSSWSSFLLSLCIAGPHIRSDPAVVSLEFEYVCVFGKGKEGKGKARKKRKQFKRPIQNNKQTIITATVRYYLYTQLRATNQPTYSGVILWDMQKIHNSIFAEVTA